MKKVFAIISILTVLVSMNTGCEPIASQGNSSSSSTTILYDDVDYAPNIGMVQLLSKKNGEVQPLENPVIDLKYRDELFLTFDIFSEKYENLRAKYVHCNKNWKPSVLQNIAFLDQVNIFNQSGFTNSGATRQPYINYRFDLPSPKLSGNYIVLVYKMDNPNEVLLSRRFLVVENKVSIKFGVSRSTVVSNRQENQQLALSFQYEDIPTNNPLNDFSVTLLQNHQWSNAIRKLKPTLANPAKKFMEYQHLDKKMNLAGWNEFRFFDLRTIGIAGRGVKNIEGVNGKIVATLNTANSRLHKYYTNQFRDINGRFLLQNKDLEKELWQSDYAKVNFSVKSDSIDGKVFVYGKLNNWKLDSRSLMHYNPKLGQYQGSLYLKQGYYDYQYLVKSTNKPEYFLEGSHFQTENEYEAIIYYRKQGNLNDEIVGYKKINSNSFSY